MSKKESEVYVKDFVEVEFTWNGEMNCFNFDFFTYEEFVSVVNYNPNIPVINGTKKSNKKVKKYLHDKVTTVLQTIQSTKDLSQVIVMDLFHITHFLTKFYESSCSELLVNIVPNPKFECRKKLFLYDINSRVQSKLISYSIKYPNKSNVQVDSNKELDIFMKWKESSVHSYINVMSYTKFQTVLANSQKEYHENYFDKFTSTHQQTFIDITTALFDNFFKHYSPNVLVHIKLMIRMFCLMHFISHHPNKKIWLSNVSFSYRLASCCAFCQKPSEKNRKKCSGCKSKKVFYCSIDCQKQHWPEHKQNCETFNSQNVIHCIDIVD
jgi:hypothetical protein